MGFWYCPTIASLCEQKKKKKKRPKRCNCIGFKPAVKRKNYAYLLNILVTHNQSFFLLFKRKSPQLERGHGYSILRKQQKE